MLKKIYRLAGLVIGLVAIIAFMGYTFKTLTIADISQHLTAPVLGSIAIAALLYATIIPVSAWAWKRMLTDIGYVHSWSELSMIMGVTQIAKYLPGNVGQHIGRAAMSMKRGIPLRPFFITVFSETLLALLAALVVGSIGAFFSQAGLANFSAAHQTIFIPALIGLLVLALLLYRPLVPRLLKWFAPANNTSSFEGLLPQLPTLLQAFGAYSLNYVMIGTGIFVMVTVLLPQMQHDFMLLLASFALAWVAGFFTPGAPAGLGVREVIMLGMLSASYPGSSALLVIVCFRLVTILGDSMCFLFAYLMLIFSRRPAHSS
jgi:glycosyltransferase 2 family protein